MLSSGEVSDALPYVSKELLQPEGQHGHANNA